MSETRRHWSTETAQYGLKIYHLHVSAPTFFRNIIVVIAAGILIDKLGNPGMCY